MANDNTVQCLRDGDIEEPLLDVHVEVSEDEPSNFWPCTFNLTKVILGAGIMVIPHAISLVGSIWGLVMLLAVGGLTWFTVYALIVGSDVVGASTYASLVRRTCGIFAEKTLLIILILGCFGFEVVYLDIISDVLIGEAPSFSGGILLQFINWLVPPATGVPGARWWFEGRSQLLGFLVLFILVPLCLQRDMTRLDALNKVGLVSLVLFAVSTIWLAVAAAMAGHAYVPPLLPDWPRLGPTLSVQISTLVSVIPVILTAMTCHQSVHPLRQMLKPYSGSRFNMVTFCSLAMVTVLFIVVSGAAYVAFGPLIKNDFLANLDPDLMTPIIGAVCKCG
uniref:Amino acid transporter transmembrane domain-containing protein n=1 Tax=Polytomella parva TaxID=51329 RepID=A0A7S0V3P5_9CHLO|mmetsp:Transcript_29537/g.54219  ORF Transcript_29537/g.54219 Transcript_29537/m.54219 type:complete len:335 (+) Transcript_29537:231-1235(+)